MHICFLRPTLILVPFRYVIDFIFVPEESRRQSIAYDMLTTSLTYKLDLAAFTSWDAADALSYKAGSEREGGLVCPILIRDDVEENVGRILQIFGVKTRLELNGKMVKPISFDFQPLRYKRVVVNGEGIRLKPTTAEAALLIESASCLIYDKLLIVSDEPGRVGLKMSNDAHSTSKNPL